MNMKKKHLIILYNILAIVLVLIGLGFLIAFENTPYIAYPVFFVCIIGAFVFAGLIDHVRKTERQEKRKTEWEDMIRRNPCVFSLDLASTDAKKVLKNEIDFNDEKNKRQLKKLTFLLIPYEQGADVALVQKCNFYDNLYDETQQEEEPTDEQLDRYEGWQMGYYFINVDELASLSGKTFLVMENLYRILQSVNLLYPFMKNNQFLVGDAA